MADEVQIAPGDTLELERAPVYAHHGYVERQRVTRKKVVKTVGTSGVVLSGFKQYRIFRVYSTPRGIELTDANSRPPMRYLLISVNGELV